MKRSNEDTLSSLEVTFIGLKRPEDPHGGEWTVAVLSGKNAGKTYTFARGQNVIIGRQEDAHIQLAHNLVSRHHTKIVWKGDEPWVIDLQSTNGTILNGKSLEDEAQIGEGDRLQVGNSLMKISFLSQLEKDEASIHDLRDRSKKWSRGKKIFSGNLAEIEFLEIIQSLAIGKRTGILVVHGPQLGKIYLKEGEILTAKIGKVSGRKALYRLLSWKEGTFDLRHLDDELLGELSEEALGQMPRLAGGDVTQILLEFLRLQDEFSPIADKVPALSDQLMVNPKKPFPKTTGYERVEKIVKFAANNPTVSEILDAFPLLDTELLRVMQFLLERGFLQRVSD